MIKQLVGAVLLAGICGAVLAAPPDMSALSRKEQSEMLRALVRANVAGENCPGYESTDSEWRFITDAADQLADHLGLSIDDYDAKYYKPAFEALDADPEFCAVEGERISQTLERVLALGGSIDKYKMGG